MVQFAAETAVGRGRFVGQVAYVHTLDELLAFIVRVLVTQRGRHP